MSEYARVADGFVMELFTPPMDTPIDRCFTPDLAATFIEVPSGVTVAPGWAYGDGAFSPPPAPPALTLAQQAQSAIAAGCQIVSTATPALDGTYACDTAAQARLTAIQTRINAGLGLPLDLDTIDWVDMAGEPHAFTAAEFTALARAVSDYVYQLDMLVLGQGSALPAQPVTLA